MVGTRTLSSEFMSAVVPLTATVGTTTAVGAATGFGTGYFKRQTGGEEDAPLTGISKGAAVGASIGVAGFGAIAGIRALKLSKFTNNISGLTPQQQQLYNGLRSAGAP